MEPIQYFPNWVYYPLMVAVAWYFLFARIYTVVKSTGRWITREEAGEIIKKTVDKL